MCRGTPVPLVCTSDYSQICMHTGAHRISIFVLIWGVLPLVVFAFGLPMIRSLQIHLVHV